MPWKPVDPAELASKTPKVEKDADAEALLWEVRLHDEVSGSNYPVSFTYVYARIKIYTQRGKEQKSTVSVDVDNGETITDLSARTIKPDGSIVELDKSSVFDSVAVKTKGYKSHVKKFVMPGVEVGSDYEYRYRLTHTDDIHLGLVLRAAGHPIQVARFHVHPLGNGYSTP